MTTEAIIAYALVAIYGWRMAAGLFLYRDNNKLQEAFWWGLASGLFWPIATVVLFNGYMERLQKTDKATNSIVAKVVARKPRYIKKEQKSVVHRRAVAEAKTREMEQKLLVKGEVIE